MVLTRYVSIVASLPLLCAGSIYACAYQCARAFRYTTGIRMALARYTFGCPPCASPKINLYNSNTEKHTKMVKIPPRDFWHFWTPVSSWNFRMLIFVNRIAEISESLDNSINKN